MSAFKFVPTETQPFRPSAPSAPAVFWRSYARRKEDGSRESFKEAIVRTVSDLANIGGLKPEQKAKALEVALKQHAFPSGRALWVAGTDWAKKPENYSGYYNCHGGVLTDQKVFGRLMDLAMCGTGTGVLLEKELVERLPEVKNKLDLLDVIPLGSVGGSEHAKLTIEDNRAVLRVGDSRKGWVDAYQAIIDLALGSHSFKENTVHLTLDLSQVRPAGERLKGFGGVANPITLETAFKRIISLLNKAQGRKLSTVESCLLVDEAASCVVAGGIRRTAGIRLFSSDDEQAKVAKLGLYSQDEHGNWRVDPEREALRLANHTVCYHHKPTYEEILDAVSKQYYSGEGAIQYSPEAIARANADLLDTVELKQQFLDVYTEQGKVAGKEFLERQARSRGFNESEKLLDHRIHRYSANPCFAAGTIVLTKKGYFPIESLVGQSVEIHDGQQWRTIDNFRVTGYDQDVYDLELHDGTVITATAYHTFVLSDGDRKELKDLVAGDELMAAVIQPVEGKIAARGGYLKGFLIGDGTSHKGQGAICKVYAPKLVCVDRLVRAQQDIGIKSHRAETGLTGAGYLRNLKNLNEDMNRWCYAHKHEFPYEVLNWTTEAKAEFLAGLFDADGTALDGGRARGISYQITSVSLPFLRGLVVLLRTLGISSKIGPVRKKGLCDFGPERGGVCQTKDAYRLAIPTPGSIKLAQLCKFERLKSFADRTVAHNFKSKCNRVKSITFSHVAPEVYCCTVSGTHTFTLGEHIVVGQCHEIVGNTFQCNLGEVHLNTIDPKDKKSQHEAFYYTGLLTATLLQHKFTDPELQFSREVDPIVAVCLSGLFDFFVHAFGVAWVKWMIADRPDTEEGRKFRAKEIKFLESWKESARQGVADYCSQAKIKMPNRYTAVQPSGSKALLTGASSGWHPPKAAWFIRRITFSVSDPLVSALRDWGYNVVPAQSARDDEGNLLDDINDPRVSEVLVEIPTKVSWADLPGAEECDLSQIPATSQMDLYMQVQRYYSTHTTSATIEFRESEIEPLAKTVYEQIQQDRGYIGVAMLARFDDNATFPRLPFEPISKERYEELIEAVKSWRLPEDETLGFLGVLAKYDYSGYQLTPEAACTSAACIAQAEKDEREGKA